LELVGFDPIGAVALDSDLRVRCQIRRDLVGGDLPACASLPRPLRGVPLHVEVGDFPPVADEERPPVLEPAEELEIDYTLEYPPPIGSQRYVFKGGKDAFLTDIAPARTFGSINDFEKLAKTGFGAGGRISNVMLNVILVDNEKVINTELRFEDEFARHKVLDVLGDLYLIGRPVVGKLVARKTGHMENIALVKELKRILPS